MNDYKAQIETILLDATGGDIAMHALDQATANLLQLLTEATVTELKKIKASLPDYVTDVQVGKTPKPGATEGANLMLDDIKDHFEQAITELKAQKGQE